MSTPRATEVEKQSLLGLPLVVFRMILSLVCIITYKSTSNADGQQLETEDVNTLRLVSQACRRLSEVVTFRTVTLHDKTRFAEDINKRVCYRICSGADNLSQHVRHLKVGPFNDDKRCPSTNVIGQMLKMIENLQDFS